MSVANEQIGVPGLVPMQARQTWVPWWKLGRGVILTRFRRGRAVSILGILSIGAIDLSLR